MSSKPRWRRRKPPSPAGRPNWPRPWLSRRSPVTATTDFLAPDILNKCGRAVPHPSPTGLRRTHSIRRGRSFQPSTNEEL
jgi:hypothetical protein